MKRLAPWFAGLALAAFASVAFAATSAPPTPAPVSVIGGYKTFLAGTLSTPTTLPVSITVYTAVTIRNSGSNDAYVVLGTAMTNATTASMPVRAGKSLTFWNAVNSYIAAVTASATTTIDVYQSNGPLYFGN